MNSIVKTYIAVPCTALLLLATSATAQVRPTPAPSAPPKAPQMNQTAAKPNVGNEMKAGAAKSAKPATGTKMEVGGVGGSGPGGGGSGGDGPSTGPSKPPQDTSETKPPPPPKESSKLAMDKAAKVNAGMAKNKVNQQTGAKSKTNAGGY